jgi:hypothetical protein
MAAQYENPEHGEDDDDDDENSPNSQEDLSAEFQPVGDDDAETADVPDPGTSICFFS